MSLGVVESRSRGPRLASHGCGYGYHTFRGHVVTPAWPSSSLSDSGPTCPPAAGGTPTGLPAPPPAFAALKCINPPPALALKRKCITTLTHSNPPPRPHAPRPQFPPCHIKHTPKNMYERSREFEASVALLRGGPKIDPTPPLTLTQPAETHTRLPPKFETPAAPGLPSLPVPGSSGYYPPGARGGWARAGASSDIGLAVGGMFETHTRISSKFETPAPSAPPVLPVPGGSGYYPSGARGGWARAGAWGDVGGAAVGGVCERHAGNARCRHTHSCHVHPTPAGDATAAAGGSPWRSGTV